LVRWGHAAEFSIETLPNGHAASVTTTHSFPIFLAGFYLVACGERVRASDAAGAAPEPALSPAFDSLSAPRPVAMEGESTPNPADETPCPRETGLISDGENGPNRTSFIEGRGGYWYTYADDKGSEVLPLPGEKGGTFTMANGGANGTPHAARMTGTLGTAQIVYAGMGLGLVDPKGEYDARKYKGISFWAKKGSPDSARNVRLKVPDHNTDPLGKVCTECFNDFGAYLEFTDDWKQYTITFASMKQQSDWGKPRPPALATGALYGVQFQVDDYGKKFDIWVDEIAFTGCAR
jgi:endoglucanase